MGQQLSQKRGLRSEAQKQDKGRDGNGPVPPAKAVGGAFGNPGPDSVSDSELSLHFDERLAARRKEQRNKKPTE